MDEILKDEQIAKAVGRLKDDIHCFRTGVPRNGPNRYLKDNADDTEALLSSYEALQVENERLKRDNEWVRQGLRAQMREDERIKGYVDNSIAANIRREHAEAKAEALQSQLSEREGEVAELTKALTGLTCGGSEFFSRKGERFVADIKACVDYISRLRTSQHETICKEIRARREAEARANTAETALRAMGEAVERCKSLLDYAITPHLPLPQVRQHIADALATLNQPSSQLEAK